MTMIRLKMTTCLAGPNHVLHPGELGDFEHAEASRLVKRGYASVVDPDDAAKLDPDPFKEAEKPIPVSPEVPMNSFNDDDDDDDSNALTAPPDNPSDAAAAPSAEVVDEKPTALQKAKAKKTTKK